MQCINEAHLLGIVGRVEKKQVGDKVFARLSMVTERAYVDGQGDTMVDVTWHNVTVPQDAWENADDIDTVGRRAVIEIRGFIRAVRYAADDGSERIITEIVAKSAKIVKDTENGKN